MRLLAALVCLVFLPIPADARQAPATLDEHVIVTAHAEDVPYQNLARTVVVLTREQIARLPVHSAAEVVAYAASVDVRSRGPVGVQSDFSVRGSTFGQALVLVDGVRLNDEQSGHHNGDIPVPLDQIERIEILMGPGSSLYGADAFGGTINVITRRDNRRRDFSLTTGSFGFVEGRATLAGTRGGTSEALSVSANRSAGFEVDRDFRTLDVSSQTTFGNGMRLWISHLRKDFGANGFYGPALSTERTNQTLVSVDAPAPALAGWTGQWQASYRTHGDVFLFDSTAAGIPNEHRTHTADATGRIGHAVGDRTHVTFGTELGADWIQSNNLGDHNLVRGSVFAEVQQQIGSRIFVYPGVRVDGYSTFGSAASPSIAATTWIGSHVKLRGSSGRAFRVPTFTERFYVDPANLGTPTLVPEHAWSSEAGVDWLASNWTVGAALFNRQEHDTIDFVRTSALVKWQAENIRQVDTSGVELNLRRTLDRHGVVSAGYTYIGASTDPLPLLSKYVLEYARHSLDVSASTSLPYRLELGQRVDYKRRRDGRDYWLVDTRIGRRMGMARIFVEGANLLDAQYQEITGVDMPGRSVRAGLSVGGGG
jgi:outer membrane cobalamin receptor